MPTVFSTAPFTLSPTLAFFLVTSFFCSTRPSVVALARGLEVLALGRPTPDPVAFLVVVLVFVLRVVVVSTAGVYGLRGAVMPPDPRVRAMAMERRIT